MFNDGHAKTYNFSNLNPIHVAVVIFIACLMTGINTYCSKFEHIAKLPLSVNESSGLKDIKVVRNTNRIDVSISTDFIFRGSLNHFLQELAVKITSKHFITYFPRRTFWDFNDKDPKNITFYIVVSQAADSKFEIVVNQLSIYKEQMFVDPISYLLPKKSWVNGKNNEPEITDFCYINNVLTTYVYEDLSYLHSLVAFRNDHTTCQEDVRKKYYYPLIEENHPIYFITDNSEQTLYYTVLPIINKIATSGFSAPVMVIYQIQSPLNHILSAIPSVKMMDSGNKCFHQNEVPTSSFRNYTNVRKVFPVNVPKKNLTVIIKSSRMYLYTNLNQYLEKISSKNEKVYIDENTPRDEYINHLKSASHVWLFDEKSVFAALCIQPSTLVTCFIPNLGNWVFDLIGSVGAFISNVNTHMEPNGQFVIDF